MTDLDSSFSGDIAQFYESVLVPLIFEPYAEMLANRAALLGPASVLEIACGTGVVTRCLARLLTADCAITATDLNPGMVEQAEVVGTARPVTWGQADAMNLPYTDESFDVVICQFGVMFFPDRVAAYREIGRVLKPGGTYLFNAWRDIADNHFAEVVTSALAERYPDSPPRFLARTPHGYGSPAQVESDVRAAGFTECAIDRRDEVSRASGAEVVALAYCQGTPLRSEIEQREAGGLQAATKVAAEALRARFGSGAIEGLISALEVVAIK